jgi:hypothetical protein
MIAHFTRRPPNAGASGAMTLHIFRSQKNPELNAFAATQKGEALPDKFAPWTFTGTVLPTRALPHGLNRALAEKGVNDTGFQLWRIKAPTEPPQS